MSEGQFSSRFVWHDLMTPDVAGARAFYSDLFGWTYREVDMGPAGIYPVIRVGGQEEGGMLTLEAAHGAPCWISYVLVEDVDKTVAAAGELGGKVLMPPMDIPGIGRFAKIEDPTGGVVSPLSLLNPRAEDAVPPAGSFCWHELLVADPEVAGPFYSRLFGWPIEDVDMGAEGAYHLFKRSGRDAGGMLPKPPGSGPSAWLPYMAVADVDERASRVKALGGKLFVKPSDIAGVGRFAVAADPQGASFALFRSA